MKQGFLESFGQTALENVNFLSSFIDKWSN